MADKFIDPELQASFQKALEPLKGAIGETQTLIGQVDRSVTRVEKEAKHQASQDPAQSRIRSTPAAAAESSTPEAVNAEATARRNLNRELERTVKLRDAEGRIGSVYVPRVGKPYEQTVGGQLRAEEQARREAAAAAARRDVPGLLESPLYMQKQLAQLRQSQLIVPEQHGQVSGTPLHDVPSLASAAWDQQAAQAATAQAAANHQVLQSQAARLAVGNQLSEQDQRLYDNSQRQAGTLAKRVAAEQAMSAELQRSVLYGAQSDDSLRRHGALTTEFIQAAARGQVTLREFGTQVGQTIGKFAGWTAAAAAVYGALGAVNELAQGAIHGATAVGQLHRTIDKLDTNQASAAIIKLAQDTITPVGEAGDAMFQFSRTFHTVDGAAYAAGLALRAYKLDGVSLADQVKAQTALHQQFGISVRGLGPVYDELAAGQRLFNARITDQIPLIARSASAVKNAGGSLQQFIELSTIALRTTGLSGSQLGTLFTRSAATFIKKPADQEVLRTYGLDPNEHYDVLLFHALEKAATLSGDQRRKLSQALFGPLLGARGAGLTGAGLSLVKQVQTELDPSKVKGSFLKEFADFADTTGQKLKALQVDLQALGATLGSSGIGAPLGVLVAGLDDALKVSTHILQVWQGLPSVVKDIGGSAALLFGARAITQRAGVPTGIPFFGRTQRQTDKATIEKGLTDEQDFYQTQYRRAAGGTQVARLAEQNALLARNKEITNGTVESQIRAQRVYEAAAERALTLEIERASLEETTLDIQARNNRIKAAINTGVLPKQALAAEGAAYQLGTLAEGQVVRDAVIPVRGAPAGAGAPTIGGASQGGVILPVGQASRQIQQQAAAAQAQAEEQTRFGSAMRTAGTKLRSVGDAIPGAVTAIRGVGTGLGAVRTGIGSVVDSLGGWVPALFAVGIAYSGFTDAIDQVNAAMNDADQQLKHVPQSLDDARAQANKFSKDTHDAFNKTGGGGKIVAGIGGIPIIGPPTVWAGKTIDDLLGLGPSYGDTRQGQTDAALQQLLKPETTRTTRVQIGTRPARFGQQIPVYGPQTVTEGGEYTEMIKAANREAGEFAKTIEGRKQWVEARQELYKQGRDAASHLEQLTPQATGKIENAFKAYAAELKAIDAKFQQGLEVLPIDKHDVFKQFRYQDLQTTSKQAQGLASKAKTYGLTPEITKQLTAAYQYVTEAYAGRTGEQSMSAIDAAKQAAVGAVQTDAQSLIQLAQSAKTRRGADADVAKATAEVAGLRTALRAGENQMRKDVAAASRQYELVVVVSGALSKAARAAAAKLRDTQSRLKALLAADKITGASLDQIGSSALDTQLSNIDTSTALRTSKIKGVTPEADLARKQSDLAGLRNKLALVRKKGHSQKQADDLQTQVDNAVRDILQTQNQDAESLLQSQSDLAASQITGSSPEAQLARAAVVLQGLRNKAALHVKQGADPTARNNDQAAINNQAQAVADQRTQNARAVLDAQNQLSAAEVGGASPEANIARQQVILAGMRRLYSFDKAHAAGQAALLTDMAQIAGQEQSIISAEVENAKAIAQAQGEYAKSLITGISPAAVAARLRADISTAARVLHADQASGAGQAALLQDRAAYNNATEALNEQIRQDAEAKSQALYTLAESKTTDPVARARIELNAAIKATSDAAKDYGKDSGQYLVARAGVNDKRNSLKDAIVQGKEDDIQFHLDLGKISVQTAIGEYEALLRMHHLTKATRRKILEQIHQLQTQGSSEFGALNLGSIRLPTPYEIRAGLLAAQRGRNEVAPQTNHFNVTVNSEAGAAAFWTGADRHINGTGKSVQRAQGVR